MSDAEVRERTYTVAPTAAERIAQGQEQYVLFNPYGSHVYGWAPQGYVDSLRQQGFSEAELSVILAPNQSATGSRARQPGESKSNYNDYIEQVGNEKGAYDNAQKLLQGGPGTDFGLGPVAFNKPKGNAISGIGHLLKSAVTDPGLALGGPAFASKDIPGSLQNIGAAAGASSWNPYGGGASGFDTLALGAEGAENEGFRSLGRATGTAVGMAAGGAFLSPYLAGVSGATAGTGAALGGAAGSELAAGAGGAFDMGGLAGGTAGAGGSTGFTTGLGGTYGFTGLGGAEALGSGLGAGLENTGGTMDFFSDLDWDAIDAGEAVAPWTTDPSFGDLGGVWGDTSSLPSWLSKLGPAVKNLLGGGGSGGGSGAGGSNFNPYALAAGLTALNYARNQDPFDTSKLENAYTQISPAGLTGQFDINTGLGRNQLTSNLERRGVMGSSFANQDLANFDMARDVGRSNLLTGGATAQANIGNQILQAQIAQQKNKNDLYGRALLALSGVGAPRNPLAGLF